MTTSKRYYLYLDEMLENLTLDVDYFSLAGFIVAEDVRDVLDARIKNLKEDYSIPSILHWTEFRRFKDGWQTKSQDEIKAFLKDFIKIIKETDMIVLASMYDAKLISQNITSTKWLSHRHIYCMKKIFENFFIFLNKENNNYDNVEGHIIVESSTTDEELKKLFHSVMIFGTDFVSQKGLTKFIKDIEFISKADNNNLLQVADPMPSELYRYKKKNDTFSMKLTPYKSEIQELREVIDSKSFRGYTNRKDLFGIHILE